MVFLQSIALSISLGCVFHPNDALEDSQQKIYVLKKHPNNKNTHEQAERTQKEYHILGRMYKRIIYVRYPNEWDKRIVLEAFQKLKTICWKSFAYTINELSLLRLKMRLIFAIVHTNMKYEKPTITTITTTKTTIIK